MADELRTNLASYKLQIQQVEASLTHDEGNVDLIKLRDDLQEVIDLTVELINQQKEKVEVTQDGAAGTSADAAPAKRIIEHDWIVGDMCMAVWSLDSQYYPAKIEEILPDESCTVTFVDYDQTEVIQMLLLKPYDETQRHPQNDDSRSNKPQSKHDMNAKQREYKRKKSQKKAQRLKQMEEEHETDKNRWLNFNHKTLGKAFSKGKVKKSIFATSEQGKGRVGVGTCGTSGKPMTNYVMLKLKKGK